METIQTIATIELTIAALIAGLWLRSWTYERRAEELYEYKPKKRKSY